MDRTQYVSYLRVSTQKQGYSGLGLEAQKEIIRNYLNGKTPVTEYVEVESGHNTKRNLLHHEPNLHYRQRKPGDTDLETRSIC